MAAFALAQQPISPVLRARPQFLGNGFSFPRFSLRSPFRLLRIRSDCRSMWRRFEVTKRSDVDRRRQNLLLTRVSQVRFAPGIMKFGGKKESELN